MVYWRLCLGNAIWKVHKKLYRPPYVAGNMVDLLNNIKNRPLKFPPTPKIN
jgi:hypothetical protein